MMYYESEEERRVKEWESEFKENLDAYDRHEDAHMQCPTCHELFPNAAPAFIPFLLSVECIPCWTARKYPNPRCGECSRELQPRTGMGMPGAKYDHLCSQCADKQKMRDLFKSGHRPLSRGNLWKGASQ